MNFNFNWQELNLKLQNIDFAKLNIYEIGLWPLQLRIIVIAALSLITMVLIYFLIVSNKVQNYSHLHEQQMALRKEFTSKYSQAANLDLYKQQMVNMKKTFHDLLMQLPAEGQVAILMEEISTQATSAGLEFKLIRPGKPIDKGFYQELPIKMAISGSYHGLGEFISSLAKMERIVTLHNFDIRVDSSVKNAAPGTMLIMEVDAKTYWYTTTAETGGR